MTTAMDVLSDLTWDDLLEAINPAPPSVEERLRRALVAIIKNWEEGRLTDAQASALIQAIATAYENRRVSKVVSEMVNDFFTPQRRRKSERRLPMIRREALYDFGIGQAETGSGQ